MLHVHVQYVSNYYCLRYTARLHVKCSTGVLLSSYLTRRAPQFKRRSCRARRFSSWLGKPFSCSCALKLIFAFTTRYQKPSFQVPTLGCVMTLPDLGTSSHSSAYSPSLLQIYPPLAKVASRCPPYTPTPPRVRAPCVRQQCPDRHQTSSPPAIHGGVTRKLRLQQTAFPLQRVPRLRGLRIPKAPQTRSRTLLRLAGGSAATRRPEGQTQLSLRASFEQLTSYL